MLERHGTSISFIEVDPHLLAGLPIDPLFSGAMWYRIFLPNLLPAVDRILYLDVDTIVADSLSPLWEIDVSESYLAAVTNVFQHNHLHRPASLGLAGPEVYFNSGVLLFNLEEMRRADAATALRKYAVEQAERIEWPDQDTLNVVLGSRRVPLHPRWNVMNSMRFPWSEDVFGAAAVAEARRSPAIRHFEGPGANKPWHYMCEWEGRELYLEHRRSTPWPRVRLEGRTPGNVGRRVARTARARIGRAVHRDG
jgi:lipopolysaccharide biosynthesis glycosyltransferase